MGIVKGLVGLSWRDLLKGFPGISPMFLTWATTCSNHLLLSCLVLFKLTSCVCIILVTISLSVILFMEYYIIFLSCMIVFLFSFRCDWSISCSSHTASKVGMTVISACMGVTMITDCTGWYICIPVVVGCMYGQVNIYSYQFEVGVYYNL